MSLHPGRGIKFFLSLGRSASPMTGVLLFAMLGIIPPVRAQDVIAPANQPSTDFPAVLMKPGPSTKPGSDSAKKADTSIIKPRQSKPDLNRDYFFRHKLELSVETGWLQKNVPFMFDFLLGDDYTLDPLRYTLAPVLVSLRWQLDNPWGPKFLRGTWDATFGGTFTVVPRGPESRFFGYTMGLRRNFVQPHWRVVPYLDGRVGIGNIDAKAPKGIWGAQGQDLTFPLIIESGLRYRVSPRYSISAGVGYMHISNLYLSEPKYQNFGINVVGPMVGFDMLLGSHRRNVPH